MKSKRIKISNILNILIFVILSVLTIILTKPLIIIIGAIALVIINFLLSRLELKYKFISLKELMDKKEFNKAVEYINSRINDVYMLQVYNSCIVTLIQLYMMTDDIKSAVNLLNTHKYLNRNQGLLYIKFILAIAFNDYELIVDSMNKLLKIKNKLFDVQKDSAKRIYQMITTNVMDEVIYNNTSYPLIRRICERCNDNSIILIDNDIKLNSDKIKNRPSKKHIIINNLLNILTFLSIPIGLFIINIGLSKYDYLTTIEHGYYFTSRLSILYIFILIPVINLIYSIYLKRNGYKFKFNLFLSLIFIVFICIFGSFTHIFKDQFILDDTYFSNIQEKIELDMSDEFYVIYEDYDFDEEDKMNDGLTVLKNGIVRFKTDVSVDKLKWIDELSNAEIASPIFLINVKDYEYFLVYDLTSHILNPDTIYSGHKYIIMAFDKENPNIIFNECIYK